MRALLALLVLALALAPPALADAPLDRPGGLKLGLADGRYLKLDTSNKPITGELTSSVTGGCPTVVYGFSSASTSGVTWNPNRMEFCVLGSAQFFVGNGLLTGLAVLQETNGTAGAPSYSFTSDATTGIFRVGASDLGVATGSTLRFDVSTTAITSTLPHLGPVSGSAATPSYTFTGNTNTGFSSTATNETETDNNGTAAMTWDASGTHVAKGHFDGGAPGSTAATIGTSTCTVASVSSCSDMRCKVTGTCTTGQTLVVNFGTAYSGSGPNCIFAPLDSNGAKATMSIATGTASFTLTAQSASASGAGNYFVQCMQ